MDDQKIEYFLRIADAGSISAAAKQLNISQPPLTRQLQLLEAEVGHLLFERTRSGVTLTPAGQVFYRYAMEWTDSRQAMRRALDNIHANDTCELRLGIDHVALESFLVDAAAAYLLNDSRVHLTISQKHSSLLISDLQRGALDAVIARVPYQPCAFHTLMGDPEPYVAFGRRHFFAGIENKVLTREDIERLPQINCVLHQQKNMYFHLDDVRTLKRLYVMDSASFTLTSLACRGLGVVIAPRSQLRNIKLDDYESRPVDLNTMVSRVDLLWDGANRNPALLGLLDALQVDHARQPQHIHFE